MAMARDDYRQNRIAWIDRDLTGFRWLVSSSRGLYAVDTGGYKPILHGWYFGLARDADHLFIFQNCGMWERSAPLGRIVRIEIKDRSLGNADVLVKDLDTQCHQIRLIDDALCVVDTANQRIRRFTKSGDPIDDIAPFAADSPDADASRYRHINSIARIGDRIAVMCHNGASDVDRKSAIAWLDNDWRLLSEDEIDGHHCHDFAVDQDGSVWSCASREGAIISNDRRRIEIASGRMTRGLVVSAEHIVVGLVTLAPRSERRNTSGDISILDRPTGQVVTTWIPGPPSDITAV
jgi:hypothetical protein